MGNNEAYIPTEQDLAERRIPFASPVDDKGEVRWTGADERAGIPGAGVGVAWRPKIDENGKRVLDNNGSPVFEPEAVLSAKDGKDSPDGALSSVEADGAVRGGGGKIAAAWVMNTAAKEGVVLDETAGRPAATVILPAITAAEVVGVEFVAVQDARARLVAAMASPE